ncbi:YqaA family protein [Chitinimonas sp. BJYL2]|uniref:YqaA family protein n=1 Tax=Chitinimonas sp. BJYL2 TaxID=2976696 RepID=UPI0022B367A2|nr:DedA family protein [Chitinimonas sp. BJYL2]
MIGLEWLTNLSPAWGLSGLFLSAFLSSTLLPGNSELLLAGWLSLRPETLGLAVALATLGNTAGGTTTFLLGKLACRHPGMKRRQPSARTRAWLSQAGSPVLLLSWLPVLGDGLCFAAGYLGIPTGRAVLWMGAGKGLRYLLIALPWL